MNNSYKTALKAADCSAMHDPIKQRAQVLRLLQIHGALTTTELRDAGVMHPAGRVAELRGRGYSIETVKRRVVGSDGRAHVQATYVLRGGCHE